MASEPIQPEVIVIGAGQAGLATGYQLQQAGIPFVILEAGAAAGGAWPHYYESLTLFSPVAYSSLPGFPMPGGPDAYPRRDEVVAYLRAYAERFALPIRYGAKVEAVAPGEGGLTVRLASGETLRARAVVAASGTFGAPYRPELPGLEQFEGRVLHSADYRSPDGFEDKRVVVVGAANSAVQIAIELQRVAAVTLASRRPVRYAPQRLLGRDVHFWFRRLGIDAANLFSDQGTPVLDDGRYRAAIARGEPARKPMFDRVTKTGVVWSDGAEEPVDALILATGFRPDLPYLPRAEVMTPEGKLRQKNGRSATVDGLYFIGQPGLRRFASGVLRGVGGDAAVVVRQIAASLGR